MTAIIVNNRALTRETQIYRAHILEISIYTDSEKIGC